MNLLYESMTKFVHGNWTIRVWRQWDGHGQPDSQDLIDAVRSIPVPCPAKAVLDRLVALDGVNAVEAVGLQGGGALVYKDWP